MSKISKALDKYKKEHNLSSAQIFNLNHAKPQDSNLKTGEDRTTPENVDVDAAERVELVHPSPAESINSATVGSRESGQQPERPFAVEPDGLESSGKPTAIIADQQPEKIGSRASENRDTGSVHDYRTAVLSEPEWSGINLDRIDPNLVSVLNPNSVETEIFKVLRAKILFPTSDKPPRSIMVTSAVPGEGKSFVASNLAVNMAQNIDDHVLLMDCDLRRPTIHQIFGLGRVKGLSEHLSNGNKLTELLIKTGIGKLSILPSGAPPHNPTEILSSAKMAGLLDELKTRYQDRYIIIESPPPMLAPETGAIAKHVDAIIVVIKFASTPMDEVEELIDSLGKEKIIGAVVNRFDARTSRYYGYHKYGKYYRS